MALDRCKILLSMYVRVLLYRVRYSMGPLSCKNKAAKIKLPKSD